MATYLDIDDMSPSLDSLEGQSSNLPPCSLTWAALHHACTCDSVCVLSLTTLTTLVFICVFVAWYHSFGHSFLSVHRISIDDNTGHELELLAVSYTHLTLPTKA